MDDLQKIFWDITESTNANDKIKILFKKQIETGAFCKDEDKFSHFCVYFPAYDPKKRLVFIGHHKKSGLWLVNGGHIDKNETPKQALKREIGEEWGINLSVDGLSPALLTITNIESNPARRSCKTHLIFGILFRKTAPNSRPIKISWRLNFMKPAGKLLTTLANWQKTRIPLPASTNWKK